MTNFSSLFVNNVPVIGGGGPIFTTGNVFYVDSGSNGRGNTAAHGKTKEKPFSTMDYAVSQCTANNGDVVIVMPGHVETVIAADGLDIDVDGISWYGIGRGSDRPQINLTTSTAAQIEIAGANTYMENFLITGGIDAIVLAINVSAADCTFVDIETRDVTGQMTVAWELPLAADRTTMRGIVHRGAAAAGATKFMNMGSNDGFTMENFWIDGNFSSGVILTSVNPTNMTINNGYVRTRNSADVIFSFGATATGNIGPNIYARIADNAANITEAFVGADCQFFQPISIVNADGEVGLNTNITASTDAA